MATLHELYASSPEEAEQDLHNRYVDTVYQVVKAAYHSGVELEKLLEDVKTKLAEGNYR